MSKLMFENSKYALGFACVILVGAAMFASTQDFVGVPQGSASNQEQLNTAADSKDNSTKPAPTQQPYIADFASDDELIDDAGGFDPNPNRTAPPTVIAAEPVVVEANRRAAPRSGQRSYGQNSDGPRMVPGKPSSGGLGDRQEIRLGENVILEN